MAPVLLVALLRPPALLVVADLRLLVKRRHIMSVTVLSKRLFKIDQKENLIPLFKELRGLAKKQNGFISRGTFSSLTDPGEYIVISEWETVDDWRNWMDKKETRKIQGKIDSLLGEKTFFDVYLPEKF